MRLKGTLAERSGTCSAESKPKRNPHLTELRTTMIFKRLLSDIIFWALANGLVFLAAPDTGSILYEPRGQLLLAVVNILWFVPLVGDAYVPEGKIRAHGKDRIYYLTMSVLLVEFAVCAYEYTHFRVGESDLRLDTVIGLALICLGFLLSIIAWLTIRRFSSPRFQIIEGHRIVDSGIYHFIRHPIYLSLFLIAAGVPIALRSVGGCLLLITLVIPAWIYIANEEEKFLLLMFKQEYKLYLRKTKKFIPFLY